MARVKTKTVNTTQVEVDGKAYTGTYTLENGIVTAEWDGWTEKTQAGANAIHTAKQLLRELVRKNRQ